MAFDPNKLLAAAVRNKNTDEGAEQPADHIDESLQEFLGTFRAQVSIWKAAAQKVSVPTPTDPLPTDQSTDHSSPPTSTKAASNQSVGRKSAAYYRDAFRGKAAAMPPGNTSATNSSLRSDANRTSRASNYTPSASCDFDHTAYPIIIERHRMWGRELLSAGSHTIAFTAAVKRCIAFLAESAFGEQYQQTAEIAGEGGSLDRISTAKAVECDFIGYTAPGAPPPSFRSSPNPSFPERNSHDASVKRTVKAFLGPKATPSPENDTRQVVMYEISASALVAYKLSHLELRLWLYMAHRFEKVFQQQGEQSASAQKQSRDCKGDDDDQEQEGGASHGKGDQEGADGTPESIVAYCGVFVHESMVAKVEEIIGCDDFRDVYPMIYYYRKTRRFDICTPSCQQAEAHQQGCNQVPEVWIRVGGTQPTNPAVQAEPKHNTISSLKTWIFQNREMAELDLGKGPYKIWKPKQGTKEGWEEVKDAADEPARLEPTSKRRPYHVSV